MFILLDFTFVAFFSAIYLLVFFSDIKIKSSEWFTNLKISTQIQLMIDAILYGVMFMLFQILFINDFNMSDQMYFLAAILITLTKGYAVAILAIMIPLSWTLIFMEINIVQYFNVAIVYTFIVLYIFATYNLDAKKERFWPLAITFMLMFILMFVFGATQSTFYNGFQKMFIPTTLSIISYWVISYFIRASESANALYKTVNFTFSNYFRSSLKERIILEKLKEERINYGFYVLFNFEIKNSLNKNEYNEVLESILLDIEDILPKEVILFKSAYNYGFFYPKKKIWNEKVMVLGNYNFVRTESDELYEIQKLIQEIPTKYKTTKSKFIDVKIFCATSIYGIHSQSIVELNEMAEFVFTSHNYRRNNIIPIYSYNKYKRRVIDSYDITRLNEFIGLDNVDVFSNPILDVKTGSVKNLMTEQTSISEKTNIDNLFGYKKGNINRLIFDRYTSGLALKKYKNANLIYVQYTPFILNKDFQIKQFMNFIDTTNYVASNICLIFEAHDLNLIEDEKLFLSKLEEVIRIGVKISLRLTDDFVKNKIYRKIKFVSIINNGYEIEKINYIRNYFKGTKIIIENINTEKELSKIDINLIDGLVSDLILCETNTQKLTKQSKIYLSSIFKGDIWT